MIQRTQMTWTQALSKEKPLLLPAAHDALSARLIEQAGFTAYVIGGFPLLAARHALPDLGLAGFGEMQAGIKDIISASSLPLLVDADDGYGDVKNVIRTVQTYESMGAQALFMEDQVSPKRCGHLDGKEIVPQTVMTDKFKAAAEAKTNNETFLIARTDSLAVYGLDEALRRAEAYLMAGADGIFIEAPQTVEELEKIGAAFDVPQMANMLESGRTPILSPTELGEIGFAMVSYPVTMIFRIVKTMQQALKDLQEGKLNLEGEGVGFDEFKEIIGLKEWSLLDEQYSTKE
jgi:2-methylisocitrate lyase-like PEP mutase family enzyme